MGEVAQWFESYVALPQVVKSAGHIKSCGKALKPAGDSKKDAPKKNVVQAKKADDDDLDLFGDDDEGDAEAAKAAAAAAKAKATTAAKPKKVVIAQSMVMFEVKPLDDTTDLDLLAKTILAITMDGLYWKT